MENKRIAEELYNKLLPIRQMYEENWYECSKLTLPYVYNGLESNETSGEKLYVPYNSIGASSVNNLASKLMINLFPPTKMFFRFLPDEKQFNQLDEKGRRELDKALTKLENDLLQKIEKDAIRIPIFEALKNLIITGNSLVYKTKNSLKVFNVSDYVVERDFSNNLLNLVIKEKIGINLLSDNLKKELNEEDFDKEKNVTLYTYVKRLDENNYEVSQHIGDLEFNVEKYTAEKLPYMVLRFNTINNSYYGIGLVEQYLGDIKTMEILSRSISEGSELMSKLIIGRKPGIGKTNLKDLQDAVRKGNGNIIYGDVENDLSILQFQKNGDFNVPFQLLQQLEMKISKAFLNFSNSVRDAERVTASEIRANIVEIESTLGGVFGVLTQELQLPLLKLMLNELNPKALKSIDLSITTGLNSISKEKDLQNLQTFTQSIAQFGGEVINQYLDIPAYFDEVANALGIDGSKILKSEEQIKQENEAQQQMMLQQQQQEQSQKLNQEAQKVKNG
jgi:hypothetical protein